MAEYENLVFNFPDSHTFSINKVRYNIITPPRKSETLEVHTGSKNSES